MNKNSKKYIIGSILVLVFIILVCSGVVQQKNSEKKQLKELSQEQKENIKSAKQLKEEYDSIIVGDKKNIDKENATSIKDITKKLGEPVFNGTTTNGKFTINTQEWASGVDNELPADLTVNLINDAVVEKSISNLYVSYNPKLVVKKTDFNDIKTNGDLTINNAIKKFGEPNNLSEYINDSNQKVDSLTWNTNVTGPIDSFFNIVFINNKANSKTEIGLE